MTPIMCFIPFNLNNNQETPTKMLKHPGAPLAIQLNHSSVKHLIKSSANLQNYFSILSFPRKLPLSSCPSNFLKPSLRFPEQL